MRLVELHVGGGFGGRGEFYPEDFLIPFCALRLGRPVIWTGRPRGGSARARTTRASSSTRSPSRSAPTGSSWRFATASSSTPARYVRTHGTVVPSMTAGLLPGPYRWGAYDVERRQVVTNKTPAGTYRAPGRYEANFARERIIDIAAHRLGLDPVEIRRRNLIARGDRCRYRTGTADRGPPGRVRQRRLPAACSSKALERVRLRGDASPGARSRPGAGRRRGLGVGYFVEKSAIAHWDYARVELDSEGRAVVHGGQRLGRPGCRDRAGADLRRGPRRPLRGHRRGPPRRHRRRARRHGLLRQPRDRDRRRGGACRPSEALRVRILRHAGGRARGGAGGSRDPRRAGAASRGSPARGVSLAELSAAARAGDARSPRGASPG